LTWWGLCILLMKKTAILIDGEFFSIALRHDLGLARRPSAKEIYQHACMLANDATEEIWRVFYYDSHSSHGRARHPVTGKLVELSETGPAKARARFLSELGQMDLIALRCGQTRPRGWHLTDAYLNQLAQGRRRHPTADDYELRFEQKGVDMRIGIDVATLSHNRYVDRIIVVTNDTDLIPALKVARRCGVQVVIAQIGSFNPHHDLIEDADFKRRYSVAA
jgi:uncharacterized LabA/DUF88 family protein